MMPACVAALRTSATVAAFAPVSVITVPPLNSMLEVEAAEREGADGDDQHDAGERGTSTSGCP